MSSKPAPKSLFVRERSNPIKDSRDLYRWLKEHTTQKQLDNAVAAMLDAAAAAEVDSNIEQGKRYADNIREFAAGLKDALSRDNAPLSALLAIRLTHEWDMLRMDATVAAPVRSEERRTAPLKKGKKKPAPDVLADALASGPRAAAAKKLGVSKRSLQRWKNQEKLR